MEHQLEALGVVLLNVVFPILAGLQVGGWIEKLIEKYLTERKKA